MLEMPLPASRVISGPIMMNGRPADDCVNPAEHARGGGGHTLPQWLDYSKQERGVDHLDRQRAKRRIHIPAERGFPFIPMLSVAPLRFVVLDESERALLECHFLSVCRRQRGPLRAFVVERVNSIAAELARLRSPLPGFCETEGVDCPERHVAHAAVDGRVAENPL